MKQVEEAAGDATKALEDATGGAGGAGDAVKGLIKGFGKWRPGSFTNLYC
jgi:hypothetical protein